MSDQSLARQNRDTVETCIDGVHYAIFHTNIGTWRMGSVNPLWREDLVTISPSPTPSELDRLAERGTWLSPATSTQPAAVICCGLGSAWPGMGRDLYANFPAAAKAMDTMAAMSGWDILSLMDETDLDKISQTRWQIPYLFFLEYAQWAQLSSLGFQPALAAGHSIGELAALCIAGVYSLESAWHLFDIRAAHMAAMEEQARAKTGMLGIQANRDIIDKTLALWPGLRISNINTAHQYVLSGARDQLAEARKALRRQHIPAFMLNVGVAFHNPAMRELRALSYRGLEAFQIRPPTFPVLSCVTAAPYPTKKDEICRQITDLDENTVDWPATSAAIRSAGIQLLVELGPQETLCGLSRENEPESLCLSTGKKGRETIAMRELCARLFALGQLSFEKIASRQKNAPTTISRLQLEDVNISQRPAASPPPRLSAEADVILGLLADASGKSMGELNPDLDLRYDLGLRSSSFPLIAQEAEKRLGRQLSFEKLLQISTVGDLIVALSDKDKPYEDPGRRSAPATHRSPLPLMRFWSDGSQAPVDPDAPGLDVANGDLILLCVFDPAILGSVWGPLAASGCVFAVPRIIIKECRELYPGASQVVAFELEAFNKDSAESAMARLTEEKGLPKGVVFSPESELSQDAAWTIFNSLRASCWRIFLQRFPVRGPETPERALAFMDTAAALPASGGACRIIAWLDDRLNPQLNPLEAADLLALEISHGKGSRIIWKQSGTGTPPPYCLSSNFFDIVFPDQVPPLAPAISLFQGECHYSRFRDPSLSTHGAIGQPHEKTGADPLPWLPVSSLLEALMAAATSSLPWLRVGGLSYLRIFERVALPPGVTRECRIAAHALHWLELDGARVRLCALNMDCRAISANGRGAGEYPPLADCLCSLSPFSWPVPEIIGNQDARTPLFRADSEVDVFDFFYKRMGLGGEWRFIHALQHATSPSGAPVWTARVNLAKSGIAIMGNRGYKNISLLTESVEQACMMAIAANGGPPFIYGPDGQFVKWRLRCIGYMRFDPDSICQEALLTLRQTWSEPGLIRFDAQARDKEGKIVLAINQLEFRMDAASPGRDKYSGAGHQV